MKKAIKLFLILIIAPMFISQGFAQDSKKTEWELVFLKDLEKIRRPQKTDGLGYTLSEEEALEKAIKTAMDNKAPACEALRIAVDRNFNPYDILTGIFKAEAKVDLNQLCMCATETGDIKLPKSLMAQAANAAADTGLINREEVTQAQCLQQGLGFTPEETALERGDRKEKEDPYSKSAPG